MSPGVVFERVYRELKRRLGEGLLPPAMPIDPIAVGAELGASITPVRDALHRLVGEQLVDAPAHDGFRVPQPSEAALRDLYAWNGCVLGLAARCMRFERLGADRSRPAEAAALFLAIARATGSGEHARAVARLNDRLAPYRRAEAQVLQDTRAEHAAIAALLGAGDRARLNHALAQYHRRRTRAAPDILALLLDGA